MQFLDNPFWQHSIASVAIWQWSGLVIALFLIVIFHLLIIMISRKLLDRIIERRYHISDKSPKILRKMANLIAIFASVHIFLFALTELQFPNRFTNFIREGVSVVTVLLVVLIARQVLNVAYTLAERMAQKTKNTLDDQLLPTVNSIVNIAIWTFGLIYVLEALDVNITALVAGVSIGGLALALAAQDTVKNIFGSIIIFLDRPFQIGDWIHYDGVDGTVEEVNLRSTRIRTFENSLTYIPNGKLADSVVNNMGLREFRRFKTEINVTYDTPPEIVETLVEGVREIIKLHPYTRKDNFEVHLNSFGSSSINILVYLFFETQTWKEELEGRHQILYSIIKLADRLGVRFAFPTQTLHIEEIPELGSRNSPTKQTKKDLEKNLQEGLEEISVYMNTRS